MFNNQKIVKKEIIQIVLKFIEGPCCYNIFWKSIPTVNCSGWEKLNLTLLVEWGFWSLYIHMTSCWRHWDGKKSIPMSLLMSWYNNIISPLSLRYLSVGKPNICRRSEYELSCKLANILVALHCTLSMFCRSTVKYGPQMALPYSIISLIKDL